MLSYPDRKKYFSSQEEPLANMAQKRRPDPLVSHVVKQVILRSTPWDSKNLNSFFVLSQCIAYGLVWHFCITWLTSCKEPIGQSSLKLENKQVAKTSVSLSERTIGFISLWKMSNPFF